MTDSNEGKSKNNSDNEHKRVCLLEDSDGGTYFVLGVGGGGVANKEVFDTLTCRGLLGKSPPELENSEILKLSKISKK